MEKFLIGSQLMVIGMGTVFFFLVIMIFAMKIAEKVIQILNKYYPEQKEENTRATKNSKKLNDVEIAIAIAAAIRAKEMSKC